ncbi:MAG TPA: phosphotransferase, partial [Anaerolineaceae bacterium]|nr:phosphotransferase [Anaerolineaceae bacterium]
AVIPHYGVMGSWFAPLPLALIMISGLIYLRIIPHHSRETDTHREKVGIRKITHYVAGDYIGSLFWMGAAQLQPIMITELAGPSATAYFFLSWQVAYVLYLVSRQMGQSLVAEVAADPVKLNIYSIKVLKQTARMILPVVAGIVIGAPYILHLFGQDYASEATTLLRLLSLSAVPQILVALYLSIARIQRRMASLVGVQAAVSILAVVMIYSLVPIMGINGVGIAWLASMTLVALFLAVTQMRNLWLIHLEMTVPMQIFNTLRTKMWDWGHTRAVADANQMVSTIIPNISPAATSMDRSMWNAHEVMRTVSDVTVISIGPDKAPPLALLKMSRTDNGAASLRRQSYLLAMLQHDDRLGDFRALLPKLWGEGEIDGRFYLVEELLPGIDGRKVVVDPLVRERMLHTSANAILELHRRTAVTTRIGPDLIRRWVDDRLEVVKQIQLPGAEWMGYDRHIDRLKKELYTQLNGRRMPVSWVHGDYAPGNILVSAEGEKVFGIVDWDLASAEDIPMLDIIHMLLATRILLEKRELGHVIRELLNKESWTKEEGELIERMQQELPGDPLDLRSLVLLSWLRHISANLTKSSRFANHTLWVTKNVEVVLGNL